MWIKASMHYFVISILSPFFPFNLSFASLGLTPFFHLLSGLLLPHPFQSLAETGRDIQEEEAQAKSTQGHSQGRNHMNNAAT